MQMRPLLIFCFRPVFLLLGIATLGIPAAASQPAAHLPGDVVIEAGAVTAANGVRVAYEIGTLFVPENRTVAGSRTIGIGFARIRAKHPTGAPPVFVLPGGPGRSYLNAFTGNDAAARSLLAELLRYTEAGDVVVIDQRGWSARGDILELAAPGKPLGEARSREAEAAEMTALAHRAVAAYPGKDLAGYTVVQCAEDVNDLRVALRYPKISLSGQSFGSQWSFAVMRLHPDIVARAVISGTEPLDRGFDMPSQILASLQRVAWEAEQDPKLKPYLPKGGLMGAIRTVEERLRTAPVTVVLSGPARRITLGVGDFQASLLRSPATWPAFILSVYHGRYAALAQETAQRRANVEGPVRLIEQLIDSSLGAPSQRAYLLNTDPATDLLGFWDFEALMASARDWPTPALEDAFRMPVPNKTPVIFIHGDWDIATPIENMLGMLPYFPNARAVLVHRGTHRSREPLFAQRPDIAAQIVRFLRSGKTDGLPVEAVLPAPAFDVPDFAPPARAAPASNLIRYN
jgi:pimeloyl-ACP methyl ester carboxylesterase